MQNRPRTGKAARTSQTFRKSNSKFSNQLKANSSLPNHVTLQQKELNLNSIVSSEDDKKSLPNKFEIDLDREDFLKEPALSIKMSA